MSLYRILARRFGPQSALSRDELMQSRRDAIKLTLAASAGLLLSGPSAWCQTLRLTHAPKRIVVVGGGFAGLACAHELKAAGHQVIVIEARSRVGGRVVTFKDLIPGKTVEGGGELIGSNHAHWLNYAKLFGLEFLDVPDEKDLPSPIRIGGKTLDEKEGARLWAQMHEALTSLTTLAREIDADRPWTSPRAALLDAQPLSVWLADLETDDLTRRAVRAELEGLNGVSLEDSSLLAMLAVIKGGGLERYWSDSESFRCKGGNQQLADKFVESIGAANVILRSPVVGFAIKDKVCTVRRADGQNHECDVAILSMAPTQWRKFVFEPALPPPFAIQMGRNTKYLVSLRERVWQSRGHSQYALTDRAVSQTWEATAGQSGAPEGQQERFCLTAFSGGPAVDKVLEPQAGARVVELNAELEQVHPGLQAAYLTSRLMDWTTENWTQGSYSFPAPGQLTSNAPSIAGGFGPIRFCGEHTCHAFCGYMEGALKSGADLARSLAADVAR